MLMLDVNACAGVGADAAVDANVDANLRCGLFWLSTLMRTVDANS